MSEGTPRKQGARVLAIVLIVALVIAAGAGAIGFVTRHLT